MRIFTRKILPVFLCLVLFVFTLGMPIHKAQASAIVIALGLATAAVVLMVSTSMIADQSRDGTLGDWVRNIDWGEFQQQAREWAASLSLEANLARYSPAARAIIENTDWTIKVNEDTGKANLTHEEVSAITEAISVVYPEGVPIKIDTGYAGQGIRLDTGYVSVKENELTTIGSSGTLATGYVTQRIYDGISITKYDGAGTPTAYSNVTMFLTNVNNVAVTGSYGYTLGITPIVFAVKDSACYTYLMTHTPYGNIYNSYKTLAGFVTVMGSTTSYTSSSGYWNGDDFIGNTKLTEPIINGTDGYGYHALTRTLENGTTSQKTIFTVDTQMLAYEVVDHLKIKDAEYNALMTTWANSIAAGQTAAADKIAISIAQSNAELAQQLQGTVSQSIEATNAQTAQLVDAINAAVAAAAAAAAVGELDLSKMTLGQNLMMRFPFCIPFDLAHAFEMFKGAGTAPPVWPVKFHVMGQEYGFDIDLTYYEPWAIIVRWGILVAFNVGLILVTRKIIKG